MTARPWAGELQRLLVDFAAEYELDVARELLNWGPGTTRAAQRIEDWAAALQMNAPAPRRAAARKRGGDPIRPDECLMHARPDCPDCQELERATGVRLFPE